MGRSVGGSVGRSVGWSVGRSVGRIFSSYGGGHDSSNTFGVGL